MRRLVAWAPAWMWLFWLVAAVIVAAGFWRGNEPQPRFLVATGTSLEIWHGADRESTLYEFADGSSITDAALSPDGRSIAFTRFVLPTPASSFFRIDLYVIGRDGSNPRPIVQFGEVAAFIETPVWLSADEVAYAIFTPTDDGSVDRRIEAVSIATGARRRIVSNADQPSLMADGRRLIVRYADIGEGRNDETPVYVDVATGTITRLPAYNTQLVYVGSFAQSPDGARIALGAADPNVRVPGGGGIYALTARTTHPILQDVWLMDLDGGNLVRIADLAVHAPSLAWTEDGVYVYAMSHAGFWRINAKTGAHQKISPGLQSGRIKLLPGPTR